jgi:hypothetical protein
MSSGRGVEGEKSPKRDNPPGEGGLHQCNNRKPPGTMLNYGREGTIGATVLATRARPGVLATSRTAKHARFSHQQPRAQPGVHC